MLAWQSVRSVTVAQIGGSGMLPQKLWKTLWKSRQLVAHAPVKYGRTASCTTMVRAARAGTAPAAAGQSLRYGTGTRERYAVSEKHRARTSERHPAEMNATLY